MAAVQDDELGQYMLAEMYANGEGTTKNYYKAAEEYQKAVDGDVTSAFHALVNLYLYVLKVPQESLKAVELFSQKHP
jgi:TPR repeat protein